MRVFVYLLCISNSIMGQKYESQPYEIIKSLEEIEVRHYPSSMMAKTKASSGNPFSTLFRYISGNNKKGEKIEMLKD